MTLTLLCDSKLHLQIMSLALVGTAVQNIKLYIIQCTIPHV